MTAGLRPAIAKHENPASIVPNADAPELAPVVPGAPAFASSFVPTTSVIAIAAACAACSMASEAPVEVRVVEAPPSGADRFDVAPDLDRDVMRGRCPPQLDETSIRGVS